MRSETVYNSGVANHAIYIQDESGVAKTSLDHTSAIAIQYRRQDQATWATITKVAGTIGTATSGGFKHDQTGVYQLGLPADAMAGGTWVLVQWSGSGIKTDQMLIPIHRLDHQAASVAQTGDVVKIQHLLEADRYIDTSPTPWQLVLIKKGTGALGVGTELLRQDLQTESGGNVTSISTFVGQQVSA